MKSAAITSARNNIQTSTWELNFKNRTFDQYCLLHVHAHNILKRYDVPMDEPTKVREFIRGIHNTSLQLSKLIYYWIKKTKSDLNKAITVFKNTVNALELVVFDKQSEDRKIGAASANNRGNYRGGSQYRGGGQNSGQSTQKRPWQDRSQQSSYSNYRGGFSRSYRGRGGGRSSYNTPCNEQDDGLLLDQSILSQMNPRQRAAYFEGRKKIRNNGGGDNNNSTVPRHISATITQEPQPQNDDASRLTSTSAAFGRNENQNTPSSRSINERRSQGAILSSTRRISSVNMHPKLTSNNASRLLISWKGRSRHPSRYNMCRRSFLPVRSDISK